MVRTKSGREDANFAQVCRFWFYRTFMILLACLIQRKWKVYDEGVDSLLMQDYLKLICEASVLFDTAGTNENHGRTVRAAHCGSV